MPTQRLRALATTAPHISDNRLETSRVAHIAQTLTTRRDDTFIRSQFADKKTIWHECRNFIRSLWWTSLLQRRRGVIDFMLHIIGS